MAPGGCEAWPSSTGTAVGGWERFSFKTFSTTPPHWVAPLPGRWCRRKRRDSSSGTASMARRSTIGSASCRWPSARPPAPGRSELEVVRNRRVAGHRDRLILNIFAARGIVWGCERPDDRQAGGWQAASDLRGRAHLFRRGLHHPAVGIQQEHILLDPLPADPEAGAHPRRQLSRIPVDPPPQGPVSSGAIRTPAPPPPSGSRLRMR